MIFFSSFFQFLFLRAHVLCARVFKAMASELARSHALWLSRCTFFSPFFSFVRGPQRLWRFSATCDLALAAAEVPHGFLSSDSHAFVASHSNVPCNVHVPSSPRARSPHCSHVAKMHLDEKETEGDMTGRKMLRNGSPCDGCKRKKKKGKEREREKEQRALSRSTGVRVSEGGKRENERA